jgi:methionyl-tRNA formyltransferase
MLLDAGMDTGPVLSRQEIPVGEDDCFGTIHDKLARLGAELLCETLVEWKAGRIVPRVQDEALATLAPPVTKEEYRLDWQLPARQIVNRIRAFDPMPGAFAFCRGKRLKCFRGRTLPWRENGGRAGEVVGTRESALLVLGGDGNVLGIGALQLEGQRRMSASEFLRGHPLPPGTVLE